MCLIPFACRTILKRLGILWFSILLSHFNFSQRAMLTKIFKRIILRGTSCVHLKQMISHIVWIICLLTVKQILDAQRLGVHKWSLYYLFVSLYKSYFCIYTSSEFNKKILLRIIFGSCITIKPNVHSIHSNLILYSNRWRNHWKIPFVLIGCSCNIIYNITAAD